MKGGHPAGKVLVSCSVFRPEIESLGRRISTLPCHYPSSMLHMKPERLASILQAWIERERRRGYEVVLVYGDCCTAMGDMEQLPGVVRTEGINCIEILLGSEQYRRLVRERVFFLLPEWTTRWREVFQTELGLDDANASAIMQEIHCKLVYIDTGVLPVPLGELRACSEFCGLPFEVLSISPERLASRIAEALQRLEQRSCG